MAPPSARHMVTPHGSSQQPTKGSPGQIGTLRRKNVEPPTSPRTPRFGREEVRAVFSYSPGAQLKQTAAVAHSSLAPLFVSARECTPYVVEDVRPLLIDLTSTKHTMMEDGDHGSDCSTVDTDTPKALDVEEALRSKTASDCSTVDTDTPPGLAQSVEWSELTQPWSELPSVGSGGHGFGMCRPCVFVHTKGCASGQDCAFCHVCPPDAKKIRKKAKGMARGSCKSDPS